MTGGNLDSNFRKSGVHFQAAWKLSESYTDTDRAKAIQEITRDLPAKYKPMIEDYFKSLNRINGYDSSK